MSEAPIFIVGTPRSGTTLLAAILSAHSRLDCGPETHFFCNLTYKYEIYFQKGIKWPEIALNYVTSLTVSGEKVYKIYNLTTNDIKQYLLTNSPSVNIVLESLTKLHASKLNKPRWIEKTPNHLLFLKKIRKYYPFSFITRILRDFRDSALSMRKLPWASNLVLHNLILLSEWYYMSEDDIQTDTCLFLVQYEKLIKEPFKEIEDICNFIQEDFESEMITNRNGIQHLFTETEWWKKNVASPLDPSRCYVWKREMDPEMQLLSTYMAMTMLKKYGYEIDVPPPKETIFLFPFTSNIIEKYQKSFYQLAKDRIRTVGVSNLALLLKAVELEKPTKVIFLYPLEIGNFSKAFSTIERSKIVFEFLIILEKLKKTGIPLYYLDILDKNLTRLGRAEKLLNKILKQFTKKETHLKL